MFCMCVLILVLMDDALVRVNKQVYNKENKVLILVLMDDALVRWLWKDVYPILRS